MCTIAPRTNATLLYALSATTEHSAMRIRASHEGSLFECMLRASVLGSCMPVHHPNIEVLPDGRYGPLEL